MDKKNLADAAALQVTEQLQNVIVLNLEVIMSNINFKQLSRLFINIFLVICSKLI